MQRRKKIKNIITIDRKRLDLRDYANSLGLIGVWHSGPKISLISFGTLSNNKDKHPDRICMDIDQAAQYIKWLIDQPKDVNINEISIDPMQERQE